MCARTCEFAMYRWGWSACEKVPCGDFSVAQRALKSHLMCKANKIVSARSVDCVDAGIRISLWEPDRCTGVLQQVC